MAPFTVGDDRSVCPPVNILDAMADAPLPTSPYLGSYREVSQEFADDDLVGAPEVLKGALKRLMTLTGADAGMVAVQGLNGEPRRVAEWRVGNAGPGSLTVLRDVLGGPAGHTLLLEPPESLSALDARITSVLCVPIRRRNQTLAAVYLDRRGLDRDPFSDGEAELAGSFAAGVAMALHLRTLLDEAHTAVETARAEAADARAAANNVTGFWSFGNLITRNEKLADDLELIARVAPSTASILILGETGTGKEFLARCVHDASPRKDRPFLVVNCAAIPETLIESELFGIARRVATGVDPRKGMFELADGGTLFLDELGELPVALQPKLLQAVESKRIRPLGSEAEVPVDVRILAATNRDLHQAIADGKFRDDLYYRLAVATIELPSLRERREDIPAIARRLVKVAAETHGRSLEVQGDALARLQSHDYPGNIRELRNIVELATLVAEDGEITTANVELALRQSRSNGGAEPSSADRTFREQMDEAARRIVSDALERGGSISGAARLLGLTRQTVSVKCQKLGLTPQGD